MTDYRCPHCGITVQRDNDKAWIKSWCTALDKNTRLMRVKEDTK